MTWEQQLDQLARERGPALVGYAYLLTGELHSAQDLVQEALIRTFSRRIHNDVEFIEAYVRRTILTTYLNTQRRGQRWNGVAHLVADADTQTPPDDVATDRADVRSALGRLSPRERACVVLRHFEDLTIRDIAHRLDLSEGAVKRYLSDARLRLAPMLGDADREDVDVIMRGARR